MRHSKLNGINPCKTRPGEVRIVAYQADYSSAEAAAFANVPKPTVYRGMREGHLPKIEEIPGHPRIKHEALIRWMEQRGFPVPNAKRGTAPRALAIPTPSRRSHQQRTVLDCIEPIPDITLEGVDYMDVPAARLNVAGWCLSYNADPEGWLANTDEAIEEAEVSLVISTVEMRALAATLNKMADELEAPAPSQVQHTSPITPIEAASPQLLDLRDAATRLGVSVVFLRKEIVAGRLPAYRLSNQYRLGMADINHWLAVHRVATPNRASRSSARKAL